MKCIEKVGNDYSVFFQEKDEVNRVRVYLVPHNVKIMHKSLFTINMGYIELDDDPNTFHSLDSEKMSLDVMESIVEHWGVWHKSREAKDEEDK